jgi:hypothetical protein
VKRWLAVIALLCGWALLLGAQGCPPPNPQPTPTPIPTPVPEPSPICPPVGATCGCWHNPGTGWQQLPPCPPPEPTCPATCPQGTACTDPALGCVALPPEPTPDPTVCTIPLDGTPVIGVYLLYPRVLDATPKITNAARCALPEVGYYGRQTCPVCDEACKQRGICEQQLMGGTAPVWHLASDTLKGYSEDGWKLRIAGNGRGAVQACYPNGKACSPWQNLDCGEGGCNR